MALHNDALQRVAGGQHLLLGLGSGHLADDGVHRAALEAHIVGAPLLIGGSRAKQLGIFLTGVVRAGHIERDDVEVVFVHALLVKRVIHTAHLERDAQLFQIAHPAADQLDCTVAAVQIFDHHGLARSIAQRTVLDVPPRISQQFLGFTQVAAQAVFGIRARRLADGAQRSRRQTGLKRLEQRQLCIAGAAMGFASRVAKQPMHTLIGAIEHLAAHPLEVICQAQRFAHTHILQLRTAGIEEKALKARWQLVLEAALDQLTRVKTPACQAPGPVTRAVDAHQVELAGLQRLQPRRVVFVDLDADAIEVGHASAHRQIGTPVRRVAHIGDVLAKLHRANLVRPAANGHIHHHLIERLGLAIRTQPPVTAEDGQRRTHRQRQIAVGLFEAKAHRALIQHVATLHLGKQRLVARGDIFAQQRLVAVLHILRQHGLAIVKARLGPDLEGGRHAIGRHLHILGQQAVARGGLVQTGRKQGLEQHVRQIGGGRALDGEGVVLVEGGIAQIADHAQLAALGGLRVHIIKVLEVGRITRLTPQCIRVLRMGKRGNLAAGNQGRTNHPMAHATILP